MKQCEMPHCFSNQCYQHQIILQALDNTPYTHTVLTGSSVTLPDSSPQLDCGDHKPTAHCTEVFADTGWMSCGTGCCLEMFCSSLKEKDSTDTHVQCCVFMNHISLVFPLPLNANLNTEITCVYVDFWQCNTTGER